MLASELCKLSKINCYVKLECNYKYDLQRIVCNLAIDFSYLAYFIGRLMSTHKPLFIFNKGTISMHYESCKTSKICLNNEKFVTYQAKMARESPRFPLD